MSVRSVAAPAAIPASLTVQRRFLSPHTANGQTAFTYPLPSTTKGRLIVTDIRNGSPGGSGASGVAGVVRSGGGPGAPGLKLKWEISIAELIARFPSLTTIYVDFGTLGTPGAGQNGGNGAAGTTSSDIVFRINDANGAVIRTAKAGTAGGGGFAGSASSAMAGAAGTQVEADGNPYSPPNVASSNGIASSTTGAAVTAVNNAADGPTAGGPGAGLASGNAEAAGGKAGNNWSNVFAKQPDAPSAPVGGVAGAGDGKTAGDSQGNPASTSPLSNPMAGLGGSGGGSSNSTTTDGGKGADGVGYGAGGGGGGACKSGGTALSGAGGRGTWGCVQFEFQPA